MSVDAAAIRAGLDASAEALRARIGSGDWNRHQVEIAGLVWGYAHLEAAVAARAWATATADPRARLVAEIAEAEVLGHLEGESLAARARAGLLAADLLDAADLDGPDLHSIGESEPHRALRARYREFTDRVVIPVAQRIHRETLDIPDPVIEGAAQLGLFGLSIPERYGGRGGAEADPVAMLIATEELSRGSLNAAGSLITRPEILVRALLSGGTEAQRERWLPGIASGDRMVAVAVTEPGAGSDVAALECRAERRGDAWILNGRKRWAGFSARAELVAVLARTGPPGGRGLSMFVVEKPRFAGTDFEWRQPEGGVLRGRAIRALGYRGMHTYDLEFEGVELPGYALVGGEAWLDRGMHLQLDSFTSGRLQTAGRAVGVMRSAFDLAHEYAEARHLFGGPLAALQMPRSMLGGILAASATARRLAIAAASADRDCPEYSIRASEAKLYACRLAERAARDAQQLHGGNGYDEAYPVSRVFLDARVLTIFEGAEEVLALRVLGRQLVAATRSR